MEEREQFMDPEVGYSGGKDKVSFKIILLNHLRKILTLSCVEYRGGFFEQRLKGQYFEKYYIQDSRSVYNNSVDSLYDILYAHFDKIMLKEDEEIQKVIKKLGEKYMKEETKEVKGKIIIIKMDENTYRHELQKLKRKLFRSLNCFLKRMDYFKGNIFED